MLRTANGTLKDGNKFIIVHVLYILMNHLLFILSIPIDSCIVFLNLSDIQSTHFLSHPVISPHLWLEGTPVKSLCEYSHH